MATTIICNQFHVDSTQHNDLEKFFGSPTYLLLREVVASKCIEAQVNSMNAALYPNNTDADAIRILEQTKAANYNTVLDLLDDISQDPQKWVTVKMEHNSNK